jgi:hypothetical protein
MLELSFVCSAVAPVILTFPTKFILKIFTLIFVSILEILDSDSALESLEESTLVKLALTHDELSKAISSVLLPLTFIDESAFVNLFAFSMLVPLHELPNVDGTFS